MPNFGAGRRFLDVLDKEEVELGVEKLPDRDV
jgi:hypothetical protein